MVHGKCKSAGCYAMTDALIEEIYALARESYIGGQDVIQVHAMPFRMTDANLARHAKSPWLAFWTTLKQGYDYFEQTRLLPEVAVCQRQYMVNVKLPASLIPARVDPEGACPTFERPKIEAFTPRPVEQASAQQTPITAPKDNLLGAGQAGQLRR